VFNSREAKRLFSFLAAGGITGGIFGGYVTNLITPLIGSEQLIFLCIIFWVSCIYLLKKIWKIGARKNYRESLNKQKFRMKQEAPGSPLKMVLSSKHLLYIAAIVAIGSVTSAFVDFQYAYIASESITNEDELTAFFGLWLSNLSLVSLMLQFFFTSRIIKRFGITTSLHFLPLGISFGAIAILISPTLLSGILIKVTEGGFKQSINKSGLELLYLPIPSRLKINSKAFIDVSVDGLAIGVAGILLIVFTQYLQISIQAISVIVLLLIIYWIYLIFRVREEYINSFRVAIEKRNIDLDQQTLNLEDASIVKMLLNILTSNNERQILYALKLMENVKNVEFLPALKELLIHPSDEIKELVLNLLKNFKETDYSEDIQSYCQDKNHKIRIAAMRYILHISKNPTSTADYFLSGSENQALSSALISIGWEYRENDAFRNSLDVRDIIDGHLQKSSETSLSAEDKEFIRINLARFIGIINEGELNPFLITFLQDKSEEVIKVALESAGSIKDSLFLPYLFKYLKTNKFRNYARKALIEYGEEVLTPVTQQFRDINTTEIEQISIARVLSKINSQRSVDLLWEFMNTGSLTLRFEIIKALNKLRANDLQLKFDKKRIDRQIKIENENFVKNLTAFTVESHISKNLTTESSQNIDGGLPQKARELLIKALRERLDHSLERIFRLLGLKYSSQDIYNAYLGISSGRTYLKANAIEFLDNVLEPKLKSIIIPIVENYALREESSHITPLVSHLELSELIVVREILVADDSWLKIISLHLVPHLKDDQLINMATTLIEDRDNRIQEAAEYVLHSVQSA
jgi:AAA family ATP:ADP antiporter